MAPQINNAHACLGCRNIPTSCPSTNLLRFILVLLLQGHYFFIGIISGGRPAASGTLNHF